MRNVAHKHNARLHLGANIQNIMIKKRTEHGTIICI